MDNSSNGDHGVPEQNVFLAMILGWAVPGLGHLYMRKYKRALFCSTGILLLFFLGLLLCRGGFASRLDFPFYLAGKYGSGFVLFGHWLLSVEREIDFQRHFHYFEIGVLCISVAGLLNSVSVLNLIDIKAGRTFLLDLEEEEEEEGSETGKEQGDREEISQVDRDEEEEEKQNPAVESNS